MKVRLERSEAAAAKWAIEEHGAEPHDIEVRESAIAYVEEVCAVMGYELKWGTLGIRVAGVGKIVRTYTACVGNMAWETPHIVIEIAGTEYLWRTESEAWLGRAGVPVRVLGYAYGKTGQQTLRGVKICENLGA